MQPTYMQRQEGQRTEDKRHSEPDLNDDHSTTVVESSPSLTFASSTSYSPSTKPTLSKHPSSSAWDEVSRLLDEVEQWRGCTDCLTTPVSTTYPTDDPGVMDKATADDSPHLSIHKAVSEWQEMCSAATAAQNKAIESASSRHQTSDDESECDEDLDAYDAEDDVVFVQSEAKSDADEPRDCLIGSDASESCAGDEETPDYPDDPISAAEKDVGSGFVDTYLPLQGVWGNMLPTVQEEDWHQQQQEEDEEEVSWRRPGNSLVLVRRSPTPQSRFASAEPTPTSAGPTRRSRLTIWP